MGFPVYNILMETMVLSENQLTDYCYCPFVELTERYPFPEDLLPKHSRVESKVSFMILVSCLCDLLRSGGSFALLRRKWRQFCSSLGKRETDFSLSWSRLETVLNVIISVVSGSRSVWCFCFCVFVSDLGISMWSSSFFYCFVFALVVAVSCACSSGVTARSGRSCFVQEVQFPV